LICTETIKHFDQIKFLEQNVKDKLIFCEKPLFETKKNLEIKNNSLYIGYVLRFHPLLNRLKTLLDLEQVISVNTYCGQYLPTWREDNDYRQSYSAKKSEGGGVLLDLSHEIDYLQWLFGKIQNIKSIQKKISDLEIDTDDITTLIGVSSQNVVINMSIDYISKKTYRKMIIYSINNTYELDFIANHLKIWDKDGKEISYVEDVMYRNYMFERMHVSILSDKKDVCSLAEGLNVMDTVYEIQEQNR